MAHTHQTRVALLSVPVVVHSCHAQDHSRDKYTRVRVLEEEDGLFFLGMMSMVHKPGREHKNRYWQFSARCDRVDLLGRARHQRIF